MFFGFVEKHLDLVIRIKFIVLEENKLHENYKEESFFRCSQTQFL